MFFLVRKVGYCFFISSFKWLKAYFLEKLEPEPKSETEPAKKNPELVKHGLQHCPQH